jgi:hypothetical protein
MHGAQELLATLSTIRIPAKHESLYVAVLIRTKLNTNPFGTEDHLL